MRLDIDESNRLDFSYIEHIVLSKHPQLQGSSSSLKQKMEIIYSGGGSTQEVTFTKDEIEALRIWIKELEELHKWMLESVNNYNFMLKLLKHCAITESFVLILEIAKLMNGLNWP